MNVEKFDPALLSALGDLDAEGAEVLSRHARTLGINVATTRRGTATAVVFLHCDPQMRLDLAGISFNQTLGPVRTALVPLVQ